MSAITSQLHCNNEAVRNGLRIMYTIQMMKEITLKVNVLIVSFKIMIMYKEMKVHFCWTLEAPAEGV